MSNYIDGDFHRGSFGFVGDESTKSKFEVLSDQRIEGRGCITYLGMEGFDDNVVERAVEDAIQSFHGATALLDVTIERKTGCYTVTGIPAALPNTET